MCLYNCILNVIKANYNLEFCKSDVLEIGCGNGERSKLICNQFKEYYATDISKKLIAEAAEESKSIKITFKVDNILNTSIKREFNIIIAANVIHFMESSINTALSNMLNLLEDNGLIIIIENKIKPKNWKSCFLNIESTQFDSEKWNIKKEQLSFEHNYLIKLKNVTYLEKYNLQFYIIKKL